MREIAIFGYERGRFLSQLFLLWLPYNGTVVDWKTLPACLPAWLWVHGGDNHCWLLPSGGCWLSMSSVCRRGHALLPPTRSLNPHPFLFHLSSHQAHNHFRWQKIKNKKWKVRYDQSISVFKSLRKSPEEPLCIYGWWGCIWSATHKPGEARRVRQEEPCAR